VGIDLRPGVDQARAEQDNFGQALAARRKEKTLWTTLSIVAAVALCCWIAGTAAYIATMVPADVFDDTPAPTAPAAHPTVAPVPTTAPRPVAPAPSPTHKAGPRHP
jgi:hypothetical protein